MSTTVALTASSTRFVGKEKIIRGLSLAKQDVQCSRVLLSNIQEHLDLRRMGLPVRKNNDSRVRGRR